MQSGLSSLTLAKNTNSETAYTFINLTKEPVLIRLGLFLGESWIFLYR